jgi:CRISPR-associated protein Cas2
MRTIIVFDIRKDKIRYRVCKVLLEYGERVQKSVFEAPDLSRASFLRIRSRVEGLIDPDTDSVRYYQLCKTCASRTAHYGIGPGKLDEPESVEVV